MTEVLGDLRARALIIGVALPAVLTLTLVAPLWAFALAVAGGAALAAWEFGGLTDLGSHLGSRGAAALAGFVLPVLAFLSPFAPPNATAATALFALAAVSIALASAAVRRLVPPPLPRHPAGGAIVVLAAAGYCGLLPACLVLLRNGPRGAGWVCLALAVTWGGDIAGYVVGRTLGRRRLAPRVSPQKTVEGAVASCVFAVGLALLVRATALRGEALAPLLLVAAAGNVLGQAGDLFESSLKRAREVKDSFVLDSLDGLCFVAPWLYAVQAW